MSAAPDRVPEQAIDLEIDLGPGQAGCAGGAACRALVARNFARLRDRYIGCGAPDRERQVAAAALDLRGLDFERYRAQVKSHSKGAVLRQAGKAERLGYYCRQFPRALFVPDIVAVNHSKPVRSGGRMKSAYLRGVEEMGGAPQGVPRLEAPDCALHYDCWWGVFRHAEGHAQGSVRTDEQLLGYIDLRRVGDYALYSLILGHGDHLHEGIMHALHLEIVRWLLDPANPCGRGLHALVYAGYYQGGDGLRQWKRKFEFRPAYLWTRRAPPPPGLLLRLRAFAGRVLQRLRS